MQLLLLHWHLSFSMLDDCAMRETAGCAGQYVSRDVTPEYLLSLETALRTKDRTRSGRVPSIGHSNGVSLPQLAPLA